MDIALMIICGLFVLTFLVIIHEGGHFVAARAFGVRVTELMVGMPGPNIGVKRGDTKFGITPILLGGYARVCGMEAGEMSPHLEPVLAALYRRGTANLEDIASDCHIPNDDAYDALEELVEWGSAVGPTKKDQFNTYRTPECKPTKRQIERARKKDPDHVPSAWELGAPRPVDDAHALFESEFKQQYRSLPFWKRSVILIAGPAVNLVFAILAFILIYTVIGIDYQNTQTGEVVHFNATPVQSVVAGFTYIGMVVQAVVSLFNPATAAETVSQSSSVVGIVVMSKSAFDMGFVNAVFFMAAISVSLGVMNMLPIPPLDGGRFAVEVFQKLSRRIVSARALNSLSIVGMTAFMLFFIFMVNQDVTRLVTGTFFTQ